MDRIALVTLSLVCLTALGCGDGRPSRAPISGKVLIDGKPLQYGFVQFIPDDARPSQGKLDADGRFTLSCFEANDGAVVGVNHVTVSACEPIGGLKVRWLAPKKYADPATSGLTEEVTASNDSLVINLTWDGGHPFVEQPEGAGAAETEENVPFGHRGRNTSNHSAPQGSPQTQ